MVLIWLVALIAMGSLAYRQVSKQIWIPTVAAILLILSLVGALTGIWFALVWLVFIGLAVIFGYQPARYAVLTQPVMHFFRKALPPMSDTEREALEAGDVWWDGDLFCGRPDWNKLLHMPKPTLTAEEQAFLENQVETLCSMLDDWQIVQRDYDLPTKVWDYLKRERFLGMVIAKEYGGLGFSALAHSSVILKIATRSGSAAVNTMVPNSLGPGELLQHYGTEQQKQYYLPRLAAGEEIPCFALTGGEAGSDAGGMTDTGIVCKGLYKGQEVLGMRLTWDKRYITLAPIATVLGLAVKLYDPDHLLGDKTEVGITLCLIPTSHPGVEIGHRHCPLGAAFMNGPTRGKDVFIPLDWIIGGTAMAGQGWRMLMECLAIGRAISLPALSAATGQFAYCMTGAYARLRKQFKLPVGYFEGVEEALARIGGNAYTLEASRVMTANAVDQHIKPSVVSAIAKYHMTEMLRQVTNDAMDVHAGRGIQLGPRNYLGHNYQIVPVAITVEGANILTRNLIIFGQGAMRCHPYIRKEMAAAANTDSGQGLTEFDKLLQSHIGYGLSNLVRTVAGGLTGGYLFKAPVKGPTARYYRQLTRMSSALALVADVTMLLLGGELKRKECLSARLGDVLSHLYLGSAILRYYENQQRHEIDLACVHWAMQTQLYKMQHAFEEFLANFPIRAVGMVLRGLIFPLGRSYRAPSDKLSQQVARQMLTMTTLRQEMARNCYINQQPDDPVGRVENAFRLSLATADVEKKLQAAVRVGTLATTHNFAERLLAAVEVGVISQAEAESLQAAESARLDAMQVDEFAFDYFMRKN